MYISEIPQLQNCSLAKYAEDTAPLVPTFWDFFHKWRIRINALETKIMFFTKRRAPRFLPNPLILCEQVRWNKPMKYLGMHLDQKFTYQDNVNQNCCKISQSMHTLYPLIGRRSQLSTQQYAVVHLRSL